MPKSKKQSFNKKAFLKITIPALVALIIIICVAVYALYKPIADNPAGIREALIRASKDTNITAPVDAKTGDTYLPEMRLYVPRGEEPVGNFTYRYSASDGQWPASLSLTTREVASQAESGLYQVTNSEAVFEKVPYMQACQRGLTLTTQPLPSLDGEKLHHQQLLQDGRTLYIYTGTLCPALGEVADQIRRISSY